jgi:hypothetical protein
MRYLYVKWVHKTPSDPTHLYSEIGDDGYEVRRVELWTNGRKGYATTEEEVGGTALSSLPVPSLKEIAEQPGFEPKVIAAEDFQKIWMKRR